MTPTGDLPLVTRVREEAARDAAVRIADARTLASETRARAEAQVAERLRTTLDARRRTLEAQERAATDALREQAIAARGTARAEAVARVLAAVDARLATSTDANEAIALTHALLDRARPWLPDPPWTVRAHPFVVETVATALGTDVVPDAALSPGAIIERADGRVRVDATLTGWIEPQRRRLAMRALDALQHGSAP